MGRHHGRNDERARIAYLAARIMAEDGLEDFGLAKRKAARQAGVPDTRDLPTNEEIENALRMHQALYQADHEEHLTALRRTTVAVMQALSDFHPRLTGSVLSGTAGPYADINLQLYVDDEKLVEMWLMERGFSYRVEQMQLYAGNLVRVAPVFKVDYDGAEVELVLLPSTDLRAPIRKSPEGRPLERAKIETVRQLLEVGT